MARYDYIDIHVHTDYSAFDCECPMESYLKLVEDGTARGVGFADHIHPVHEQWAARYGEDRQPFDGDGYTADIMAAKGRGLNVYQGIEVTYEKGAYDFTVKRLADNPYDYFIGSAHSFDGMWVSRDYHANMYAGKAFDWVVNGYYDAILDVVAVPAFDVVGHIGVYKRYLPAGHRLMRYGAALIAEREDQVARVCAQSGKIVEVNTSGFGAPSQKSMPSDDFLRMYKRHGGERVCLASDCHDVSKLNQGFDEAADMLRAIGFAYIYYPWDAENPVKL